MASVAMLTPTMKKEPGVLPRSSLLPKRKPIISSNATRARFVKPRPNVSANKASKESLPPNSENGKVDDVTSQPVQTESETLQRPAIPKRTAPILAPSRARFQKPKPNIGSLLNKLAKDAQSSEEKSVSTTDDIKTQEPSNSKSDLSDASKIASTTEEKCNNDSNSSQVTSLLNKEKVVDTAYSNSESQLSSHPTINIDSYCGSSQEFFSIRTIPGDKNLESHFEKSANSDVSIREPSTEISSSWDTEMTLTSPRTALEVTPEKESQTVLVVLNKSAEYPTLKSILNSPRKRTTTKKVHERRKRVANFSATPSRSEMTMVDLIYWNPSSSPMKLTKPTAPAEEDLLPADDPPPPAIEETENSNIGPKVIINDDGEIILDESSLFVRRKDTVDHTVAAVVENDNTTYSSFRSRSFKTWSKNETAKFYKALSLVGTDFALMESIFKEDGKVTRTRRELKLKFKREEKSNPKFVHTAMYELQTYDLNILDEDHDIELLDESEMIDDAPKPVKKSATSGTKTPGKRGRKKKSELAEATSNENTSESIPQAEEGSIEAIYSFSDVDFGNKNNDIESNSQPAAVRSERVRKAKILSDYVTDVDDLSDTNDYLENEDETLPIKKRKRIQVLSEEEDGTTLTTDNNVDSVVDSHDTFQEKRTSINEIHPCIADETDGPDNENNSGMTPIRKRRKLQTLPKIIEENVEISNPLSDLMPETSRSGRKIKAKNMSDFIIDPDALRDSYDETTHVEEPQDLEEVNNIISCGENAENLNAVENVTQLYNSTQLEGEFSIIPPVEADGEDPGEQNIICTLNVECPNENNSVIESSDIMDLNELNNTEVIAATETTPYSSETLATATETTPFSTESLATAISLDEPKTGNLAELPDSEVCNDVNENNILSDPAITEVVVTSDQLPRRTRRKILPNVIKGSKRPPIQKKPLLPPRRTSFNSFTPVEEVPQVIPNIALVQSTKTYSKPTCPIRIKSEKSADMPEYLGTVQRSPMNISRKRSLSGPAKSPSTPEMGISRTNSVCTPTRLPLTNAPRNVFSFKSESTPTVTQSSTELPLHALTADPKTINMNPENPTDSQPPMVILTRTPNNSNMLHLFLYQKS